MQEYFKEETILMLENRRITKNKAQHTEIHTHTHTHKHIHTNTYLLPASHDSTALLGPRLPPCWYYEIALRHTTVGRTPPDEWWARCRDLYLTTHNIHKRQTSMIAVRFEPIIPVSERPQTHALERAATGIGYLVRKETRNNVYIYIYIYQFLRALWITTK